MLIHLPQVLSPDQVLAARQQLESADWTDGKVTAGEQSAKVKHNKQLPESSEVSQRVGNLIIDALSNNNQFIASALPAKIFPPLFNCYENGGHFGKHIDNAIRIVPNSVVRVRTDLSATLFLSEPDEYDGGELEIDDVYGQQSIKFAAGDMVLYPSTSYHHVNAVTRGKRLCAFFWMQSMVREDSQRDLLYQMDQSIQSIAAEKGMKDDDVIRLTGVYHNLIRRWADT
ncbi:Fe2+-dependent dioxygenase [Leucothrix sargassi]|nr:Fe2+-dependent dioxygenase [Leucothrix sargassi]